MKLQKTLLTRVGQSFREGLFGVVPVTLSGLEITTCCFLLLFRRNSVRRDIAETLLDRQLVHIGSVLVCGGGLYVRVVRRFVSLLRELLSLPRPPGRLLDVVFSYRLSGPELQNPLPQFVMSSS